MKLINTDGMALIGPGSEWLWTAVSGLVLAVTFIAIYGQLRGQRNAAAVEQLTSLKREYDSELLFRCALATLVAIRDGSDAARVGYASDDLSDFFDRIGLLAREHRIDRRLVYDYFPGAIQWWWTLLSPAIRRRREESGLTQHYSHFEWLVELMAEMDRKAGVIRQTDEAQFARDIAGSIEECQDAIRRLEELRAVIVRPMSTATLTPDAASITG